MEKLKETVLNIESPGLNNLKTYVLTHNRFNAYIV